MKKSDSDFRKVEGDAVDERGYFAALERGMFLIPFCHDCERFHFFPRVVCPHCGGIDLTWKSASGKGTVYSHTTVRSDSEGDYNVSLIDLEEGPRMMSRVVAQPGISIAIGMRVSARVEMQQGDQPPMVVFSVVAEG